MSVMQLSFVRFYFASLQRLAEQIQERNEKLKTEMLGKFKKWGVIIFSASEAVSVKLFCRTL